jgi:hypothetical protein
VTRRDTPASVTLDYTSQPGGFQRIEVRDAEPYLRDDCPCCGGDATRQYIDHDIYGGKHLAYVISPCEQCGWWLALKFWEGGGNVIHAAAVCEPIIRKFNLSADDLAICDAIQVLSRDPTRVDELHPERFERFTAEYLRAQGLTVNNIARVRGSGGDLIAIDRTGNRFLVEAKRWRGTVGIDVIWKLIGAMWENDYDVGMVVTSASFTRDARASKAVSTLRVALKDFGDLATWLELRRRGQGSVADTCRQFVYGDAMSEL